MPKILEDTVIPEYFDKIIIPDIPMPFPFWLNQKLYNETAERHFQLWAEKFGIFDGDVDKAYQVSQNLWTFNAGGNPNCDLRLFPAIADWVIMITVLDDKFDCDDDGRFQEGDAKMAFQTFVDAWNGVEPRIWNKFVPALKDTVRRLQRDLKPFMIHRLGNTIELYRDGVSTQNYVRKTGLILPEYEFGLVRRAALNAYWDFISTEIGLNLDLESEDIRDDLFLEIMQVSCESCALLNDLYSFKKEELHGDTSTQSNMARVIAKREGIPIQEAIYKLHDLVVANHFKVLELYDRADKKPYRPQMRMLIDETKYWISWLIYFMKYCPRYNVGEYMHWPGREDGVHWGANEFIDECAVFQEKYKDFDWRKCLKGTQYDMDIKFDYTKYTDCMALIGEYEPGTLRKIVERCVNKMEADKEKTKKN